MVAVLLEDDRAVDDLSLQLSAMCRLDGVSWVQLSCSALFGELQALSTQAAVRIQGAVQGSMQATPVRQGAGYYSYQRGESDVSRSQVTNKFRSLRIPQFRSH
eukprot:TRINITY_DN28807_c0_g1_i1.p1 TRINITY_DN28807_c0_g1~~TRINITY_DN28807_c0_g1_i1.p1  ORF type:complete len:103 (+),score=11.46 TRINITY_DN28807_c0_g1_i1:859-1167(+)